MMNAQEALSRWNSTDPVHEAPDNGLINRTWLVGEPPWAVLQWVNPIFDPMIHYDIEAVTARLEESGLTSPRLLPTAAGKLWADLGSDCWRLMTFIPGKTLHRIENPRQAAEAGRVAGCFHRALQGWDYERKARRRHIHDTTMHMSELHAACAESTGHPLAAEAGELGADILRRWSDWDGEMPRRQRFCHGDLKISNLRFEARDGFGESAEGAESNDEGICLIDLDTLGPMPIACEMGDAWRSWCNPAGEDDPEAVAFDTELFAASARAWLAVAPPLDEDEKQSLVPGIERICLELAARFCADALRNSYFREDRQRYPEIGTHNLIRARSQSALAESARRAREECEAIVMSA